MYSIESYESETNLKRTFIHFEDVNYARSVEKPWVDFTLENISWNWLSNSEQVGFTEVLAKNHEKRKIPWFSHCTKQCEETGIYSHWENIPSNMLDWLKKNSMISRKIIWLKFRSFHAIHCTVWKNEKFSLTKKFFVKSTL